MIFIKRIGPDPHANGAIRQATEPNGCAVTGHRRGHALISNTDGKAQIFQESACCDSSFLQGWNSRSAIMMTTAWPNAISGTPGAFLLHACVRNSFRVLSVRPG